MYNNRNVNNFLKQQAKQSNSHISDNRIQTLILLTKIFLFLLLSKYWMCKKVHTLGTLVCSGKISIK